jgi:hypothetical protein
MHKIVITVGQQQEDSLNKTCTCTELSLQLACAACSCYPFLSRHRDRRLTWAIVQLQPTRREQDAISKYSSYFLIYRSATTETKRHQLISIQIFFCRNGHGVYNERQ